MERAPFGERLTLQRIEQPTLVLAQGSVTVRSQNPCHGAQEEEKLPGDASRWPMAPAGHCGKRTAILGGSIKTEWDCLEPDDGLRWLDRLEKQTIVRDFAAVIDNLPEPARGLS